MPTPTSFSFTFPAYLTCPSSLAPKYHPVFAFQRIENLFERGSGYSLDPTLLVFKVAPNADSLF
jgi:hypothetical protein